MNADDLLDNVVARYQACSSYVDEGEASSILGGLYFKTFFCRPNKFRFEWKNALAGKTMIGVLYSNGGAKTSIFNGRGCEDFDELAVAIAAATGVSVGVAPLAAHLLMPDLFKGRTFQSFMSMKPYHIIKEDTDSAEIRANWRDCWTLLQVDKTRMSIRKVQECYVANVEEKQLVIDSMIDLPGFDKVQMGPSLDLSKGETETLISFNDVKFDLEISPDIFDQV